MPTAQIRARGDLTAAGGMQMLIPHAMSSHAPFDSVETAIQTIAAGGIIALGTGTAERQVTLVVGGGGTASTDVIVDITGYYQ